MKISKELKSYLKQYRKSMESMEPYTSKVLEFNKKFENVKKEDMTPEELDEARELWKMYEKLRISYIEMLKLRSKVLKGTKLRKKK